MTTDDQLLADYLSHHDGPAFEALVRRHGPMVLRVCRDILGDRDDAEDAFQAIFLVFSRQAGSIRDRASIGRWLYEVACRISRRERRRVAKVRFLERQVLEMDSAASSDFDETDREWKPILHAEISRLPSKLRDPIVLCYFEGLSVEEAARRLRCPVGTLKSRLGKGRELLRSRLTRRGLAAAVLLLLMFSMTEEVSAEVPFPLLDSTLKAGRSGVKGFGVSRKVALMVIEEEASRRWLRLAASWGVILLVVVVLSASRMASSRDARAAIPGLRSGSSAKPFAAPGASLAPIRSPAPAPASLEISGHCRSSQ